MEMLSRTALPGFPNSSFQIDVYSSIRFPTVQALKSLCALGGSRHPVREKEFGVPGLDLNRGFAIEFLRITSNQCLRYPICKLG